MVILDNGGFLYVTYDDDGWYTGTLSRLDMHGIRNVMSKHYHSIIKVFD